MHVSLSRSLAIGAALAVAAVSVTPALGAAAPKAGAKCASKDAGRTVAAAGGGRVTCTVSGKNTVWKAVAAAPAATAAPTTAAAGATAAPTTAAAPAAPMQEAKIRFFRSIPFDAGGAFWYLAKDKGYFKEQKLNAEVSTGQGAATAVAAVIAGEAEIGQVSADSFLNAVGQGADLVAFWQFIPSGVFGLAWDSTRLSGPSALRGKRIGVIGPSSATFFSAKLLLAQNGINFNDVQFVNLGAATPAAYAALRDGTVDALGTWDAQITAIRQAAVDENRTAFLQNLQYRSIKDYLGDVLITSRKYYKDNSDVLVRFAKAMSKGAQAMRDDPDDAMYVTAMNNPALRATDKAQRAILELRIKPEGAIQTDGTFDLNEINRALKLYFTNGIINPDPAKLDVKSLFTNDIATAVKSAK